jgi:plasmid stabilization system protein ParE
MSRVHISRRAKLDLKGIGAYVAQHNEAAARKLIAKLRATCKTTIGRVPKCGTMYDHLLPGMRCFSVGRHVIFFRGQNPVEILRIVDGAVDFNRLTFT